jgi:hypothetical protein
MVNHRRFVCVLGLAMWIAGCGGGGRESAPLPNPLAPGEVITVTLCGTTTENRAPCGEDVPNAIEITAFTSSPPVCPCFNFAFLNQSLQDLNASTNRYTFTGFRPGTYQVTGLLRSNVVSFRFFHNNSTSTIGVVPSSLRSLTGPVTSSNQSCSLGYQLPFSSNPPPANFSFEFTVAASAQGGSC